MTAFHFATFLQWLRADRSDLQELLIRFSVGVVAVISALQAAHGAGVSTYTPPEGYAVTQGGLGGELYHVVSLADSGPGTLRDAIENRIYTANGPRTVVFDVAGTITVQGEIVARQPYLTVDGSTAPPPGITIRPTTELVGGLVIAGTHDIIITHLRLWWSWDFGGAHVNVGTLVIDGDTNPDHHARNIILDHLTVRNASDGGPDVWGEVSDVTIAWCLMFYSWHPTSISHVPEPFQTRSRISLHHNVYARNGERNPQIRADVRDLDMVNNVIYDWGYFGESSGYGTRIRNDSVEPQVHANIVNNCFLPTILPTEALIYGLDAGPDDSEGRPAGPTPAQGTVLTGTLMGDLYVRGNQLPPENLDQYSTIAQPLPVPAYAKVTTFAAADLDFGVLPYVGMRFRDNEETGIIEDLAQAMGGRKLLADINGDGKADGSDVAAMFSCQSGPSVFQPDPGCWNADLDGDLDVDQTDFGMLQRCLSPLLPGLDHSCLK